MRFTASLSIPFAIALALPALVGCAGGHHAHYAGLESREIKSLSAADLEGYRAGRGMSLALPAELNGYPGPLHVLELGEALALTPSQRAATEALYQRMKADAIAAGEVFIAAERDLDRLFAGKSATPAQLSEALARVGAAQERLRGTHLQAHLEQVRILTPEQAGQYQRLRGYAR